MKRCDVDSLRSMMTW